MMLVSEWKVYHVGSRYKKNEERKWRRGKRERKKESEGARRERERKRVKEREEVDKERK